MNENTAKVIEKTADALRKNNMEVYIADNKAEAVEIVQSILKKGDVISCGGSQTLIETGIFNLMQNGDYNFLDRSKALSRDEIEDIYRRSFFADAYLTSANAVTESGEIYNVDGNSNRIAAIAYGPKSVIFVIGCNKIVPALEDAVKRVKTTAAPCNSKRLKTNTPCEKNGECISLSMEGDMPKGCFCEGRICCNYLVSAYQRHKNRFKVILVAEELGY